MRNPTRIAALAAALALPGTATSAADWPGVWRATWPNGHQTELTIVQIDHNGNAHGAYCHLTNHGRTSYIDLHPDAVLAELDNTADDVLRIKRPSRRWTFRLDAGADVVNMRFQFGDRPANEINLARVKAQTCAARIQQLTPLEGVAAAPAVAALVPDEPEHWAVGVWTVTGDDLSVDLAVLDVADGKARGLYCNLRDGITLGFHDLDPEHGIRAKVTRTKLSFKIRDTRFSFKRTNNPDVLKGTRRGGGRTQKHSVVRTDEPACASRVSPR